VNRDDMLIQAMNFTEARSNIIAQKEEGMQGQMNGWVSTYFNEHRQRQYHRNRQRVMEIKDIIDQASQRLRTLEDGDEEEDDVGDN
jgi:hypothetical protein